MVMAAMAAMALVLSVCTLAFGALATDVVMVEDDGADGIPWEDGQGVPTGSEGVPGVPSDPPPPDDDEDPTTPGSGGTSDVLPIPVETVPPKDEGFPLSTPDNPIFMVIVMVIVGVLTTYAPGEIRRIRIETAHREAMGARLALARGEFALALAAFDRAIDQAHSAYTRRVRIDRPAEWALMPDGFYVSLWRGRAAALMGLGRKRSAVGTLRIADELEAAVGNAD